MNAPDSNSLLPYCIDVSRRAKVASSQLGLLSSEVKDRWLLRSAELLNESLDLIVNANKIDLEKAPQYGLTDAAIDRLRLNEKRIQEIADALRQIARLPDPIGEVLDGYKRPNGLEIIKTRVPLGVVFFIYESRPNVTADAAAICVKSGNAVILRGGKEAFHSSKAIVDCLSKAASECGLPQDAVQLIQTLDREAVGHFLQLNQYIDVAIPRGGESLIRRVCNEAKMPVIKHFDGICHVYVDKCAEQTVALDVIENSKCHRYGVCNAMECLLVHQDIAQQFLPVVFERLKKYPIEFRGCKRTCQIVPQSVPATDEDWRREYLGPTMSVKVVSTTEEAIEHINRFGSHHTDAIITQDYAASRQFTLAVDSAAVMVNASTRFNDGGEFGFGAEIGISTDKLHARGPCGLKELTTYKYIVFGSGQVRS